MTRPSTIRRNAASCLATPKRLLSLGLVFAFSAGTLASPGAGEHLTLIRGAVRSVVNAAELKTALDAANRARIPATLLLGDGTYVLDVPALDVQCPGLVIRSAGGNRDAVVVRGPDEGLRATTRSVFVFSANDIVIADLTLGYCRHHGIQVRGEPPFDVSGLRVHNCRLVNCNQQFIKGSSNETDPVGATDGCIEHCLFEFTSGWAYQFYTGGIDIHKGVNWAVRDNLLRGIRTPTGKDGISEHAIHFWKRCPTRPQNIAVERNWIINCDRGIGFGLGAAAGGLQGGRSFIRNNLVNRPIQRRDDAPPARSSNNLERIESPCFRALSAGDLRLAQGASQPSTLDWLSRVSATMWTGTCVPRERLGTLGRMNATLSPSLLHQPKT